MPHFQLKFRPILRKQNLNDFELAEKFPVWCLMFAKLNFRQKTFFEPFRYDEKKRS